jgi:hypothetical protein
VRATDAQAQLAHARRNGNSLTLFRVAATTVLFWLPKGFRLLIGVVVLEDNSSSDPADATGTDREATTVVFFFNDATATHNKVLLTCKYVFTAASGSLDRGIDSVAVSSSERASDANAIPYFRPSVRRLLSC